MSYNDYQVEKSICHVKVALCLTIINFFDSFAKTGKLNQHEVSFKKILDIKPLINCLKNSQQFKINLIW